MQNYWSPGHPAHKLSFFLLYSSLTLFLLGQFGRISFFEGTINGYLYEFFLCFFLLIVMFRKRLTLFKDAFSRLPGGFIFILTLLGTFLVSAGEFTPLENLAGFLYTARFILYFLFLICVSFLLKKEKMDRRFADALFIFTGMIIALSTLQFFFYRNLRNLFYLGWDEHAGRVFGLFLEPYVAASVFGMLLLFLLLNYDSFKNRKKIAILFLVALSTLSFLTYSRGFYVSFFILLSILFFKTRKKRFAVSLMGLMVFTALALSRPGGEGTAITRTASVSSRLVSYREGIRLFQSRPFFGVGYNRIRYVKEEKFPQRRGSIPDHAGASFHSSFLIILATTGLIGFISYLAFLKDLFYFTPSSGYYLLFLVIFSLFDNVLLHPFILFLFVVIIAFPTPSRT